MIARVKRLLFDHESLHCVKRVRESIKIGDWERGIFHGLGWARLRKRNKGDLFPFYLPGRYSGSLTRGYKTLQ